MKIKLSPVELKPGIIILEPIITPHGQVLAVAGTALTRQIINRMKLYSVSSATVDSEDPILKSLLHRSTIREEEPIPAATPFRPTPVTEEPQEGEKVITYKDETQSNSRRMMVSKEFKGFQVDYLLYIEYIK